jgi:exopolyphosphatase/guanosine-5'-triphosphate,3'-diphosphate pyrophosphatase
MTRLAAFDLGSNSIKMTLADVDSAGTVREIFSASETVRLGAGLEATGRLADDRIDAALAAIRLMVDRAAANGVERMAGVATEAVRVATNGADFLARVRAETGLEARVIDGDAEALLTWEGLHATTRFDGPLVVADIGGASTEVIAGDGSAMQWARSLPIGSGRLTDRFVVADPPAAAELAAARAAATAALAALPTATAGGKLVVTSGTGEYLGRLLVGVAQIDGDDIDRLLAWCTTHDSTFVAQHLQIPPARARVLPAGVAVVAALCDRFAPTRVVGSASGIRAGLLRAMALGRWP